MILLIIIVCAIIVMSLYSCIIIGKKADEEMDKMFDEYEGKDEKDS